MLAGIIHPTSGTAEVLGYTPWKRDNRLRRQIALIMGQKAQLWWDLPAGDSFLLLKEIYQIPATTFRENLDYLTQVLGVASELHIQVRRLSLGERMKMELIAALLHGPRVVFLDEPTIGLDLTAQRAIRDFILEYREEHQPAMVVTSHYMEDIERLCERILILRDGEIIYDGSLRQVVDTYATHKVIVAHLHKASGTPPPNDGALSKFGAILKQTEDVVRLEVARDRVAQAAGHILTSYAVADLAIEEIEIGTIIERIQSAKESTDS